MLDKGSSNGGCCSISETSFFLKKENIISHPYTVIITQKIKNRNPFVSELRFLFGGEKEIRTLVGVLAQTRFPGV